MSNPSNSCTFIGRLTRTPELRKTSSGKSVTSFTLAVDGGRPNENGEWPVNFIDFVAWANRAEKICENWKQGDLVAVRGELRPRPYVDKNGNKRVVAEIVVEARRKLASAAKNASPAVPADYSYPPEPTDADFSEVSDDSDVPF